MVYSETLSQRVRVLLQNTNGIAEKRLFGGVGFLLRNNMACGILNDDLIVRVGPKGYEEALALPRTRVFDITGRIMKGWVMVPAQKLSDEDLSTWVDRGLAFARSPPKKEIKDA